MMLQLFDGENFAGWETYAAVLAQQNMTIPQFESILRKQLLIEKLQSLLMEGVVVSDREVEAEFHRGADAAKIEYILIDPGKLSSGVAYTPAELQAHFNANRSSYQLPEKRSAQILIVDEAVVAQAVTIQAELRRAYDRTKTLPMPERARPAHPAEDDGKQQEETISQDRAEDC
jgi:peptidyl-prolyl cis-trans isomerase D